MHNTIIHHLLTDAQPTPNSDQFLLANFPWLYTANLLYGIYNSPYNIPLASLGRLSCLLATPPH